MCNPPIVKYFYVLLYHITEQKAIDNSTLSYDTFHKCRFYKHRYFPQISERCIPQNPFMDTNISTSRCTDQETFNKIIANADHNTKMYFAGLNKGKGTLDGLKKAQNDTKASTIGL